MENLPSSYRPTRREVLLGLALSPLALAGCGGSSNNGGGLSLKATRGVAAFPVGFALPPTSLKVESGLGSGALDASGQFTVPLVGQAVGPTLAWIRSIDKVVLAGFIDANSAVIDVQSTAIALLYFALGGFEIPGDRKNELLTLIRAEAAVAPLVAAIARRMAVNPYALAEGDSEVGTALKTAIDAILASKPVRSAIRPTSPRKSAVASSRAPDAKLLLSPDGIHSNLEVLQADKPQSFTATNHARRYCRVYVYETGVEDKNGVRTNYPQAKFIDPLVPLGSTAALGLLSTLFGFFNRTTAFVPVSTKPITLSMATDSSRTYFDIVVLGSSNIAFPPAFFNDSKYAAEKQKWQDAIVRMNLASWLVDIIFGMMLEVWGLRDLVKSEAAVEAAIEAFRNEELGVFAQIATLAGSGKFVEATKEFLLFATASTANAVRIRSALAALIPQLGGTIGAEEAAAGAQVCLKMFQAAFAAVGVILGAGDLGAVLWDLANSEQGERWQATLFVPRVTLSPATATIAPGDSQTLFANAGVTGATLKYAWTLTGSDLANLAGDGQAGRSFETNTNSVTLATTPSTRGALTVAVKVFQMDTGGARTELGGANSVITVTNDIPPGTVKIVFTSLNPGDSALTPDTLRMPTYRATTVGAYQGNPVVDALFSNLPNKDDAFRVAMWFDTQTVKAGTQITFGPGKNSELIFQVPAGGGNRITFTPKSGTLTVLEVSPELLGGTITFKVEASLKTNDPNISADIVATGNVGVIEKR